MDILACLLMLPTYLRLEDCHIDTLTTEITLTLSSSQATPACPSCQTPAQRIHSHYERTLVDLPWSEYQVRWKLMVRKCFCNNTDCLQGIFSERFVEFVKPWARKTNRVIEQLRAVGLALAGAAGARLTPHLNLIASRETLLRFVRHLNLPPFATPRVLGVDDWAFRKGHNYGTILVDLEEHRPIALLADREASTLAQWLEEHPGVEIISRDRSLAYKQGATEGAPQAIQVADRFHLLENLATALEKTFRDYPGELKAVEAAVVQQAQGRLATDIELAIVPPPAPEPADLIHAQQSRIRRLGNYEQTWELHSQGLSHQEIAQRLGIGVKTVYRYLKQPTFRERQPRKDRGQSHLDPYKPYLLERWNSGVRQVKSLYEEIKARGYEQSYNLVARFFRSLKQAQEKLDAPRIQWIDSPHLPLTARRATWLVLGHAGEREEDSKQLLTHLKKHCSLFSEAITLAKEFTHMLRERKSEDFDGWLKRAIEGNLPALASFAEGLKEDYEAVKAGLTLPWSNGPVEGQINRLKMLKRQMYGRASMDLLGKRFILSG
ncbi:MAG: ISL3 family transposase [Cyanobacteria bacterium P01_G01_bin.54]